MKNELFESFACTSSGRRASKLLCTHPWSPQEIFAEVLRDANELIPVLDMSASYRCQTLSNPDTWTQWLTAERRVAGMCLAFLVRKGVIELAPRMTRSGRWSGTYCLAGSPLLVTPKPARIVRIVATGFNLPAM